MCRIFYCGWLLGCVLTSQVSAATFTVNVLTDGVDASPGDGVCEMSTSGGDCSLRAAINETNVLGGSHIINLGSGIHVLTLIGEEDAGLAGDLNIFGSALQINGQGAGVTIIDANDLSRVIDVGSNADFGLSGVTITGGLANTSTEFVGAGLNIAGMTTQAVLQNVAILDNVANAGGGINITHAQVTILDSLIQGNVTEPFGFTNLDGPAINVNQGNLIIPTQR